MSAEGSAPVFAGSPSGRSVGGAVVVLILVLLAGYGLGRSSISAGAVAPGPTLAGPVPFGHGHGGAGPMGGLAVSSGGFTLVSGATGFDAGAASVFRFHVVGFGGARVLTYETVHKKGMHLIVVRSDLSGYQHLHPTMTDDGLWSVRLTLPTPGVWRAYADFSARSPVGAVTSVVLATNLTVSGSFAPITLPAPATRALVDGYAVDQAGRPRISVMTPLAMRVTRHGSVAALQPYLGAFGHLVLVRQADLGYLHSHPDPQLADGAARFWVMMPSVGRYRGYFDFQVDGTVHTAAFTVELR